MNDNDDPQEINASSTIQYYLNNISRYPLLTAQEEVYYAQRVRNGDKQAKEHMINSNLRLVVRFARDYRSRGLDFIEVIAEGNLGLIRAVEKYDPDLGYRFSTYAGWWIKQAMERGIAEKSKDIRLPVHIVVQLNRCLRAAKQLFQTLHREPSLEEIAQALGEDVAKVDKLLKFNYSVHSSGESISDGSNVSLLDFLYDKDLPSVEDWLQEQEIVALVSRWISRLNKNQSEVIKRRFGLHDTEISTLTEIAETLNLSVERVRQIQQTALRRLQIYIQAQGLDASKLLIND